MSIHRRLQKTCKKYFMKVVNSITNAGQSRGPACIKELNVNNWHLTQI